MIASHRIEQYLSAHPEGDLLIIVGYATPAGVAWLARRTDKAGRRVSLLIGDARPKWWERATDRDRATCLSFFRHRDTEVRNWYRTGRSHKGAAAANLKVWAVHDNWSPVSVLVGSGNLTHKGLNKNVEVMAEAHGNDMLQAWDTASDLWEKAWACDHRLAGYLEDQPAVPLPSLPQITPPPQTSLPISPLIRPPRRTREERKAQRQERKAQRKARKSTR